MDLHDWSIFQAESNEIPLIPLGSPLQPLQYKVTENNPTLTDNEMNTTCFYLYQ